jgi:hypothetical protein
VSFRRPWYTQACVCSRDSDRDLDGASKRPSTVVYQGEGGVVVSASIALRAESRLCIKLAKDEKRLVQSRTALDTL